MATAAETAMNCVCRRLSTAAHTRLLYLVLPYHVDAWHGCVIHEQCVDYIYLHAQCMLHPPMLYWVHQQLTEEK